MEKTLYIINVNYLIVVIMEKKWYVVFVSYDTDAERKRVEYLLSRWSSRIEMDRPKGINAVLRADSEEIQEFLVDLLSRLEGDPRRKVKILSGEMVEPSVEPEERILEYRLNDDARVVEKLVDYVMLKLNATPLGSIESEKRYEVYTRRGKTEVAVSLGELPGGCIVAFRISGYGGAVDFLASKIDEEFRAFTGG